MATCEETCKDDRDRIWATISGIRGAVEVLTGRVESLSQRLGEKAQAEGKEAQKALEAFAARKTQEAEEEPREYNPDDWMNH